MTNRTHIVKGFGAIFAAAVLLFAASITAQQTDKGEKKEATTKEATTKEAKAKGDAPAAASGEDVKKSGDSKPAEPPAEQDGKPATAGDETPPTGAPTTPPVAEPAASSEEKPAAKPQTFEMVGTTTASPAPVKTETETAPVAPPMPPQKKERRLRHLFTISYEMAVAVGATWDFVGSFSPRGISFDYLYYFTGNVGLGVMMGWNEFEIKERGTFQDQRVTLTGTQIRRLDSWYVNASFNYSFLSIDKFASPYLGLNMGVYRLRKGIDYGWWGDADESWHFGFAPDLGVNLNFKKFLIQVGCRFHWAVMTSEADGERWVTFNIGFSIPGY